MRRNTRFSLYCLEDGDAYFGDAIVDYFYATKAPTSIGGGGGSSGASPSASSRTGSSFTSRLGGIIAPPRSRSAAAAAPAVSPITSRTKLRGHLRLAGKAILFEPDDTKIPIFTFKFKEIAKLQEDDINFVSEQDILVEHQGVAPQVAANAAGNNATRYFFIKCEQVLTQCASGDSQPFGVEPPAKAKGLHIFTFPFSSSGSGGNLSSSGGSSGASSINPQHQNFIDQINTILALQRTSASGGSRDEPLEKQRFLRRLVDVREKEAPFPLTELRSRSERVLHQVCCDRIAPLVSERGRLVVTNRVLYFQATFPIQATGVENIALNSIRRVERRRIHFKDVGVEIATLDDKIQLYNFGSRDAREAFFKILGGHPLLERLSVNTQSIMTEKWRVGELSTFDYLMYLNWAAGRSLNDLAQYPVLPWVIADYVSDVLDLDDPRIYRNLRKPIGALNEQRLKTFKERAHNLKEILNETPYLYGTHYSNPAYVTYFLVRTHPEFMLVLHNGKLDQGSRIFDSIPDTFSSVLTGPADVKELIPEFYYGTGDFLKRSKIDLGFKTDGSNVKREVQLPPWANDDPALFVRLNREALEGETVSQNIHHWIDLIFGCKQIGEEAWKADNVFHPYSYESCVSSLDKITDDMERLAIETHIKEFGQTPRQLFTTPHPQRMAAKTPKKYVSLTSFMPPDSENLEDNSLTSVSLSGAHHDARSPTLSSLRRSFGRTMDDHDDAGRAATTTSTTKATAERQPPSSTRHVDPTTSASAGGAATFVGECESSDDDDNNNGPSSPSPIPGIGASSSLRQLGGEDPKRSSFHDITDLNRGPPTHDEEQANDMERRPDSEATTSQNDGSSMSAMQVPQVMQLDLGSNDTAVGSSGGAGTGTDDQREGAHPHHDGNAPGAGRGGGAASGTASAKLSFCKAIKTQTRPVECLLVAFPTDNASWIFDAHDLPQFPVLISADAAGALTFVDLVSNKKLRTITDHFGHGSIVTLDTYSSPMLYDGSDKCLVVGSSIGKVFTVSIEHCCVDEDREVTGSFLTCVKQKGPLAVTGGRDGIASIWKMNKKLGAIKDTSGDDPLYQVDMCDRIVGVDVSKDGKHVAIAASDGEICVVNVEDEDDILEERFNVSAETIENDAVLDSSSSTKVTTAGGGRDTRSMSMPGSSGSIVSISFNENRLCVVTNTHVANYQWQEDGEVWSIFHTPFPVAVAGFGIGGCVSPDHLCLASASGEFAIVTATNGKKIASAAIDSIELGGNVVDQQTASRSSLRGSMGATGTPLLASSANSNSGGGNTGGVVIISGHVGQEHVVLGDSSGRVHVLDFLPVD